MNRENSYHPTYSQIASNMSSTTFATHAKHVTADGTTYEADIVGTRGVHDSGLDAFENVVNLLQNKLTNFTITAPAEKPAVIAPQINVNAIPNVIKLEHITFFAHDLSKNHVSVHDNNGRTLHMYPAQLWYDNEEFIKTAKIDDYYAAVSMILKGNSTLSVRWILKSYADEIVHFLCVITGGSSVRDIARSTSDMGKNQSYAADMFHALYHGGCTYYYAKIVDTFVRIGYITEHLAAISAQ